jgi:hypothetical protein
MPRVFTGSLGAPTSPRTFIYPVNLDVFQTNSLQQGQSFLSGPITRRLGKHLIKDEVVKMHEWKCAQQLQVRNRADSQLQHYHSATVGR